MTAGLPPTEAAETPTREKGKGRRVGPALFVCGGDETPGERDTDCSDPLHDHPLPAGYVDASTVADRRLRQRWANRRCRRCGLYGWVPPAMTTTTTTEGVNP